MTDIATPYAVRVAATLRLPQLISEGSTRLDKLAERAHAHPDALRRLSRLLVLREVFTEPEPGTFGLTEIGWLLLDDGPFHLRSGFDLDGFGRADLAFGGLLRSVRTGEPAYQDVYGKPLWEDLATNQELSASFDALMEQHRTIANPAVLDGYEWESVDHVVDVGGGRGSLLETLLSTHPGMRGTLVELPTTAAFAERRIADSDLSKRCEAIASSFFDRLPAGASAYLLSFILHDWSDRDAIRILDRCAEAAGADGRILLIERTNIDAKYSEDFISMDLRMLVYGEPELEFGSGPGYYALTRWDDIVETSRNTAVFRSEPTANMLSDMPSELFEVFDSIINMDGPRHARLRQIVSRAFTPRRLMLLQGNIERIVTEIICRISSLGFCDVVADISSQLPLRIIRDMMGISTNDYKFVAKQTNTILVASEFDSILQAGSGTGWADAGTR